MAHLVGCGPSGALPCVCGLACCGKVSEVFEGHDITTVDLTKALRDWGRRREQLDAGEMTPEDYRDWKDTYLPRILIDPVTGEEIGDPCTGRRLEGVERNGACRAVRAMRWLNE